MLINIIYRIFKKKKSIQRRSLPPTGQYYNLQEIYNTLNTEYFESKLNLNISWFGNGNIARTRVLFGSYYHRTKSIKINRFLDQANIPPYVVKFIVYHEMLHDVFPPKRKLNGRRSIHHPDFKEVEKQFPDYKLAKEFIKNWLHKKVSN